MSDTSVAVAAGRGVMGSWRVSLSAGDKLAGSLSVGLSVDVGQMSGGMLVNVASIGSGWVLVLGGRLGLLDWSRAGRVGGTLCEQTAWGSDATVVCQAGSGSWRVVVSVVDQVGSVSICGLWGWWAGG